MNDGLPARRDAAAPPPAVRAYTAVAVWPRATWLSARAAAMLLVGAPQRHHGRIATLRPRLIKQKTAYLVCDEMSSKIGRPECRQRESEAFTGSSDPQAPMKGGSSRVGAIPKTFKHPVASAMAQCGISALP